MPLLVLDYRLNPEFKDPTQLQDWSFWRLCGSLLLFRLECDGRGVASLLRGGAEWATVDARLAAGCIASLHRDDPEWVSSLASLVIRVREVHRRSEGHLAPRRRKFASWLGIHQGEGRLLSLLSFLSS